MVPCCVCSVDFPARRLLGRGGGAAAAAYRGARDSAAVQSYLAFVEHLVSKAPERIGVVALPFEGRNLCVYSRESGAEGESAASECVPCECV